jgi:hypothetical protein
VLYGNVSKDTLFANEQQLDPATKQIKIKNVNV